MTISAPRGRRRTLLGALVASALALATAVVAAPTATAADTDIPANFGTAVGQLHIAPDHGAWDEFLTRVWTDTGFDSSITSANHPAVWVMLQKGTRSSVLTNLNQNVFYTGPAYGPFNFGSDEAATGGDIIGNAFEYMLGDVPTISKTDIGGTFSVILQAKSTTTVPSSASDPYFRADFVITADGWEIAGSQTPKTDTTTALVASGVTAASVTLTATVSAADASGTVTFKKDGVAVGSPAPVTGGAATVQVSSLDPATAYSFTADYSGDSTYNPSTSGAAAVTTLAAADTSSSQVSVSVPTATASAPTGLKLTAKPGAVTLAGATDRTVGEVWEATGSLGNVTVNDDRQAAGVAWTLNGKASAFASGTDIIPASNLGWAPAKVSGAGTAGSAVTAGAGGGLSTDKALATGTGSADANVVTTVSAGLTLAAPAGTAAGSYTSTLTLTLI